MVKADSSQSIFHYFTYTLAVLVIAFGLVMISQTIPYLSFEFAVNFLGTKSDPVLHQWDFNLFFYTHICSSLVVLLAGISQFLPKIVVSKPGLHRFLGKIYIFLILLVAAPSGLGLSLYANGGLPAKAGFFMQSSLWFLVTLKAFLEIRKRKIESHVIWMLRSYAITLAAMSLRTESYLMKYFFQTKPFETYLTVVWVSWTGNLILCEILITFGFSKFLVHSLKNKKAL